MKRHLLTTITVVFAATLLLVPAAQARNNGPMGARAMKDQRANARALSRTLRGYKVPRSIQMAPLRAVRAGYKLQKMGGGKMKVNDNKVLAAKGTNRVTANKGLVKFKQQIANNNNSRLASYAFTSGKQNAGESISIQKDIVHHSSWTTKKDGSKRKVDKLVYPGKGGDALVATTVTTTDKAGQSKSRTLYTGVSQVGTLGEVTYKLNETQFKQKRQQTPYIFPGAATK